MSQWHYKNNNSLIGPITGDELIALIQRGEIDNDDRVQGQNGEWISASDAALQARYAASTLAQDVPNEEIIGSTAPRPWPRFLARAVDFWLYFTAFLVIFGLTIGYFLELNDEQIDALPEIMINILYLLFFLLAESASFAMTGTTPGKALLNIRVRHRDGRQLNFIEAINRSVYVMILGYGLGLLVLPIVTMAFSYHRLVNKGKTPWDQRYKLVVSHQPIGFVRYFIACGIIFAVIGIFVWLIATTL